MSGSIHKYPLEDDRYPRKVATSHFLSDASYFDALDTTAKSKSAVSLANGKTIPVDGVGSVGTLSEVKLTPSMTKNLMSVPKLTDDGSMVIFAKDAVYIAAPNAAEQLFSSIVQHKLPRLARRRGDLYVHVRHKGIQQVEFKNKPSHSAYLWHRRFAHAPLALIRKAVNSGLLVGIPSSVSFTGTCHTHCVTCSLARSMRKPFGAHPPSVVATQNLQRVYVDIAEQKVPSRAGKRYILVIVDEFSNMAWAIPLTRKCHALAAFKWFRETAESEQSLYRQDCRLEIVRTRCLRSDNGGEFTSNEFEQYCRDHRIHHEHTVPHSSQQNGKAEVHIKILSNMSRSAVLDSGLHDMWDYAYPACAFVKNCLPCLGNQPDNCAPMQRWTGRPPNVAHIRVFGCRCFCPP